MNAGAGPRWKAVAGPRTDPPPRFWHLVHSLVSLVTCLHLYECRGGSKIGGSGGSKIAGSKYGSKGSRMENG